MWLICATFFLGGLVMGSELNEWGMKKEIKSGAIWIDGERYSCEKD